MISFISSYENFSFVMPDPKMFIGIAVSVAGVGVVDSNSIKTHLTMVLVRFSLKVSHFLVIVLKVYLEILLIV